MAVVTKAGIKAREKYNAKTYDAVKLRMLKGKKEALQAYAQAQNESLNGFINRAIDELMAREQRGK